MTLGELYDAVAYLGFETALDEEVLRRSFYAVLPRAIGTVERLAPRARRVSLSHIAPCDCLRFRGPRRLSDGEVLTLELAPSAQLVSLSLFGEGSVLLSSPTEERKESFSSVGETVLSLETKGATRLTVCAVRGVTVGAIGAYGALSPLGEVLPGRGVCYELARLCPDFAAFSSPALYLDGQAYTGRYLLEGSRLTLPEDAPSGLYETVCRLAAPRFSPQDARERELPLSPELAAILPELVASLVWLDDAPEKAAHYLSLYQRNYAQLRAEMRRGQLEQVDCRNGW